MRRRGIRPQPIREDFMRAFNEKVEAQYAAEKFGISSVQRAFGSSVARVANSEFNEKEGLQLEQLSLLIDKKEGEVKNQQFKKQKKNLISK